MKYTGFKKVKEDDSSATLKNKHGHTITISKKALSPAHLESLKGLPLHASDGNDGNEVSGQDDMSMGDSGHSSGGTHITINAAPVAQPQVAQPPQGAPSNILSSVQGGTPTAPPNPAPEPAQDEVPPEEPHPEVEDRTQEIQNIRDRRLAAISGQPGSEQQPDPSDVTQIQNVPQHLNEFAQEYSQALQSGKIKPETYQQLYDNKGTLGKVGTLFGLLLSGFGSGLSGQPNAVLQMMDKEIERDLDAQKNTQSNAQNFMKVGMEYAMNKFKVPEIMARTDLTNAQKENYLAQTKILGLNYVRTAAQLSLLHGVGAISNNLPPGPNRNAAQAGVGAMSQALDHKMQQENAQTEAQYNAQTQKWHQLQMMGLPEAEKEVQYRESHVIPGEGSTKRPVSDAGLDKITKINRFQSYLDEAIALRNKLNQSHGVFERLLPAEKARAAQLQNDMVSGYNDVKGLNRFTSNEEELYQGIIPRIANIKEELTGETPAKLNQLKNSVQRVKQIELGQFGTEPFAKGQSEAPETGQGDMVRVQNPNGQMGSIPRANLKKALKQGWMQIK